MTIDAATGIVSLDLDYLTDGERTNLLSRGSCFAYEIRPGAKALIICPGGGHDVSRAFASGSKDITAADRSAARYLGVLPTRWRCDSAQD